MYEVEWDRIFEGLGWKVWAEGDYLPVSLDEHRRFNPDTIQAPFYVYDNQWVPLPIFKDISKPSLTETEVWFYNIHSKYHSKSVPDVIRKEFPSVPSAAYEHPRELCAYLLSEPHKYSDSPGFAKLIGLVGQIAISP
jgi:hypothetical protein